MVVVVVVVVEEEEEVLNMLYLQKLHGKLVTEPGSDLGELDSQ